jgi:hypothetical protein
MAESSRPNHRKDFPGVNRGDGAQFSARKFRESRRGDGEGGWYFYHYELGLSTLLVFVKVDFIIIEVGIFYEVITNVYCGIKGKSCIIIKIVLN